MANTFLNKVYNGANTSANTDMNVYTAPSTATTVVIGLTLCNTGTSQISVNIKLGAGQTVFLAKAIPIPVGSSFEYMSGNKIIMQSGNTLTVSSTIAGSLDTVASIMEIT
tara:strand:+ start:10848 stop:11177 length:330 start_codon:yes stop_codon:yes gene_type:complete